MSAEHYGEFHCRFRAGEPDALSLGCEYCVSQVRRWLSMGFAFSDPRANRIGGRMDLFVECAGQGFVIEIKLVKASKGRVKTLEEGLRQVSRYRATVGGPETATYVALFDRTPAGRQLSWEERLTWEVVETEGGTVTVVGLWVRAAAAAATL